MRSALLSFFFLVSSTALAQAGLTVKSESGPVYGISTVAQPTTALDYRPRAPVQVELAGTWLVPKAHGEAQVTVDPGGLHVEARIRNLSAASDLGPAYLTYVLWAVSPGSKPHNLGEVVVTGTTGLVAATTDLDVFAMLVTAEPYFAVSEPSDAIVVRNIVPQGGLRYKIAPDLLPLIRDRQTPLDLVQARNAVRIARRLGAERLASSELDKAVRLLSEAEKHYHADDRWQTVLKAREATEAAEAARLMAASAESQ